MLYLRWSRGNISRPGYHDPFDAHALQAQPQGVAVGADDRVLASMIGTAGNADSLLIYDPGASGPNPLVPPVALFLNQAIQTPGFRPVSS